MHHRGRQDNTALEQPEPPGLGLAMAPATFVILSGVLTFGVPLVLAVRELLMLRRPPKTRWGGTWGDGRTVPCPAPRKPLPDCLVPRPMRKTTRTRHLEDA